MRMNGLVLVLAMFFSAVGRADDKVTVLYDHTVSDARVGVFENQLECYPGHSGGFQTNTTLSFDAYWLRVADPEFAALDLGGKLYYEDTVFADRCAEFKQMFAGQNFILGTARRTATENYGIRFGNVCWHWLEETMTFDYKEFHFENRDNQFAVGPAKPEMCQ